jgi:hypothetical protein
VIPTDDLFDYRLALQAASARQMVEHRQCQQCHGPIRLFGALAMGRGHGVKYYVKVRGQMATLM